MHSGNLLYEEHSYREFLHTVNKSMRPSECPCMKLQLAVVNFECSEELVVPPQDLLCDSTVLVVP